MNSKKTLLILIIVFVLILVGAYVLYTQLGSQIAPEQLATQPSGTPDATAPSGTEPEKLMAPDFTVYDIDGNEVNLHDFHGKPIVLNFWASWCGPCKMEMPDFQDAYLAMGDDIHFVMVNITSGRETKANATAFLADAGYTFPVYYDTAADAATTYGTYSLPTTYFLDAEGYAVARATGAINAELLQQGIDMITN